MALVYGRNPGDRSGLMVQDLVRNMRWDSKPRHSRYASPAQIMQTPALYTRQFIELALGPAERTERPGAGYGEYELSRSCHPFENRQRLIREVHDMGLGILGPGIRQEPYPPVEVEL